MRIFSLLLFLSILSITVLESGPAQAAKFNSGETEFVFYGGLDSGGDKLVTTFFSDGSTGGIDAGEGLYFSFGSLIPVNDDGTFQAQFTIGLKTESSEASNGGIDFTRWPLEAVCFYNFKKVRIGAGLTYHVNPSLEGDGVASGVQDDFDNSIGTVFEVSFLFGGASGVALRHTDIEYTLAGASSKIDGSSNGVYFIFAF